MKIGVLALQGAFAEHAAMLRGLGQQPVEVRLPRDLEGVEGLIIPGGESTTIGKLAVEWGLMEPIRQMAKTKPVWGTCAGAIFLSREAGRPQPLLELMDIAVERNAFGRQVDSFEIDLDVPALAAVETPPAEPNGHGAHPAAAPFHALFIRAPLIASVGPGVEVLSRLPDGRIVAARQGHLLATSFHPELTDDDRFHRLFVAMAKSVSG